MSSRARRRRGRCPRDGTGPYSFSLNPRPMARSRSAIVCAFDPVKYCHGGAAALDGDEPQIGLESALDEDARLGVAVPEDASTSGYAMKASISERAAHPVASARSTSVSSGCPARPPRVSRARARRAPPGTGVPQRGPLTRRSVGQQGDLEPCLATGAPASLMDAHRVPARRAHPRARRHQVEHPRPGRNSKPTPIPASSPSRARPSAMQYLSPDRRRTTSR